MDTVDRTKNTCVQHNHKKKLNKKGKPNCACALFFSTTFTKLFEMRQETNRIAT